MTVCGVFVGVSLWIGLVGAFPVCVLSLFFKVCRFVFVCLFVSGGVLSGLSGGVWLCFVVFRRVSSYLFAETLMIEICCGWVLQL